MHIEIIRTKSNAEAIDGVLKIGGNYVCDISENAATALAEGTYEVILERCKQYNRKMPIVKELFDTTKCERCNKLCDVNNNTHMPQVCHMIKPGNGVYSRNDGSIIIGERIYDGCLIKPKGHFDLLCERLRKALSRDTKISLTVCSN